VTRALAKKLYPATDIPDLLVTTRVGHLERSEIEMALDHGMRKAKIFEDNGLIIGVFLAVKDQIRISPESIAQFIEPVSNIFAV